MRKPALFFLTILIVHLSSVKVQAQETAINPSQLKVETGRNYDIRFYFLDLNISDSSTYIAGHVAVHLTVNDQTGQQIMLDMLHLLHADSVKVNQEKAVFNHTENMSERFSSYFAGRRFAGCNRCILPRTWKKCRGSHWSFQ